jgi:hypothetical protein
MQQWEYCLVSHVPSGPMVVNVTYYTSEGARQETHRAKDYEDGTQMLWPQVIANLGRAGWELVSVDSGALYFKRAVEDANRSD